jgi:hypothetical protein
VKPAFRYPDKDWRAIEACLAKPDETADAHVCAYWRHAIEAIVHRYLWMTARYDPRMPEVIKSKARWAEIAKHAQALNAALDELEAIETQPVRTLGYAIAANPLTPHADYLAWKAQTAAAGRWAETASRGWPKSVRLKRDTSGRIIGTKAGPNRARADEVDRLFDDLLTFWHARGGRIGGGAKSLSTRFVEAAARRVLSDHAPEVRLPRAVVDFVSTKRSNV